MIEHIQQGTFLAAACVIGFLLTAGFIIMLLSYTRKELGAMFKRWIDIR